MPACHAAQHRQRGASFSSANTRVTQPSTKTTVSHTTGLLTKASSSSHLSHAHACRTSPKRPSAFTPVVALAASKPIRIHPPPSIRLHSSISSSNELRLSSSLCKEEKENEGGVRSPNLSPLFRRDDDKHRAPSPLISATSSLFMMDESDHECPVLTDQQNHHDGIEPVESCSTFLGFTGCNAWDEEASELAEAFENANAADLVSIDTDCFEEESDGEKEEETDLRDIDPNDPNSVPYSLELLATQKTAERERSQQQVLQLVQQYDAKLTKLQSDYEHERQQVHLEMQDLRSKHTVALEAVVSTLRQKEREFQEQIILLEKALNEKTSTEIQLRAKLKALLSLQIQHDVQTVSTEGSFPKSRLQRRHSFGSSTFERSKHVSSCSPQGKLNKMASRLDPHLASAGCTELCEERTILGRLNPQNPQSASHSGRIRLSVAAKGIASPERRRTMSARGHGEIKSSTKASWR